MTWRSSLLLVIIGVSGLVAPAHASPLKGAVMTPQLQEYRTHLEYLAAAVSNHDSDECLLWPFYRDSAGYGNVFMVSGDGRKTNPKVHRVAFKLVHGHWPTPMGLHRCNNPACFNPRHIYEGNGKNNYDDQVACGSYVHGVRHPQAKLNEDMVVKARAEYANGRVTIKSIADRYGVDGQSMAAAITGVTWKHIPGAIPINKQLSPTCRRGHPYTPENTGVQRIKYRYCKECRRINQGTPKQRVLSPTCGKGHLYTPENTGFCKATGHRYCKECNHTALRTLRASRKQAKESA